MDETRQGSRHEKERKRAEDTLEEEEWMDGSEGGRVMKDDGN